MNRLFITGGLALGLMGTGAWAQAATADRSKNDLSDRDITQKIRKSIVDDSSLSTYAHNVKIVARGGQVTLKGPVRSDDERRSIEQKATEVAGAGNVTDQITVKPKKSK